MLEAVSPLERLQGELRTGAATPASVVQQVLARANGNASRNTYLSLEPQALSRHATALARQPPGERGSLWSVPVSLKDCFDLEGTRTTCGSAFYARRAPASGDSSMAMRLRQVGALITGKTHLHCLAYGITGQNPEYGDCLQPRDERLLTGGSSSGGAASVQEGSALVAIGTDTGGSIRVPAALCGLVGYRASHELAAAWPGAWRGAAHLAPSFDTLGFLLRDPRDTGPVAEAVLGARLEPLSSSFRVGCVSEDFLEDCEPSMRETFEVWKRQLSVAGAALGQFDARCWEDALEIFSGIQASEAAALHTGNFERFEPAIRDRLLWGASLSAGVLDGLRQRLADFREQMRGLLARFDLLMMPCAPVSRLPASDDLSSVRSRILRYTTPFSLAGLPTLSLPGEIAGAPFGTGVQIAAAPGGDAVLCALSSAVGRGLAGN